MKTNVLIAVVSLVVGMLLGGFSGAWLAGRGSDERRAGAVGEEAARAGQLEVRAARLDQQIELLRVNLTLGRIAIEAQRHNYGVAGQLAGPLFDDIARLDGTPMGEGERAALQRVLAARDEVVAGLATAQPAAAGTLQQLYLDLFASLSAAG